MHDLSGRIALVTGSSRGIGRAVALALAREGADIVLNFRSRLAEAQAVETEIRALGRRCVAIRADVSLAGDVHSLIQGAEGQIGAVDILVNNAGIARPQAIEDITEKDWDELITVNLKSCFLVTQAVLRAMRSRKWGRIVNISSVAAQVGGIVGPHYAASKAGMQGLTHYYASHLAKEGITVNSIAPALIETDMLSDNPNRRSDLFPVGRFGQPEEVADVVVMLARNGFITGQTINVNGGWFMS
jgi:3-oxoacyl-[acyl-carrier protein] reductase